MKIKPIIIIVLIIKLTISCSSAAKIKISSNPMINEVVLNYYKSNKHYIKNYSVFHIQNKINTQKIQAYMVIPEIDEIAFKLRLEDSISNNNLPTHYLKYKSKLFLWREEGHKVSDSVMKYIYDKGLVDSSYVKYQKGLIKAEEVKDIHITLDESLKGVIYVFCKSKPYKIKRKIKSNKYIDSTDKRLNIRCD